MPHFSPTLSTHTKEAESKRLRAGLAMETLLYIHNKSTVNRGKALRYMLLQNSLFTFIHQHSFPPSLLPSLPEPCVTMVTRVKITNKNIPPTESVQESLERRFGRVGGRIPITPSQSFQERISVRSCVTAVRLAVMLGTSSHQNFTTFQSHSLLTLLPVSRINFKEIRFWLVREV